MYPLIYIHGFISSPGSQKAREIADYIARHNLAINFLCPQLSNSPAKAIDQLCELVAGLERKPALIGSSLGGYYATYLAERFRLRAVLVNPAVSAAKLLPAKPVVHFNPYTKDKFSLSSEDIAALEAIDVRPKACAADLWLMVQSGDETLDYRLAVELYRDCRQLIEYGGSHRFENFAGHLAAILAFLCLPGSGGELTTQNSDA